MRMFTYFLYLRWEYFEITVKYKELFYWEEQFCGEHCNAVQQHFASNAWMFAELLFL